MSPTPPAAIAAMLAVLHKWRDQLNASRKAAAWVEIFEERGAWRLEITVYTRRQNVPVSRQEDESGAPSADRVSEDL